MLNSIYRAAGSGRWIGEEGGVALREILARANTPDIVETLANFAGVYDLGNDQFLVAAPGSVESKLKVAFALNRHDTMGMDCVAVAINNIACYGVKPLFFSDYICSNKLYPDKLAVIMDGISRGCRQSRLALIGGKTTELPGFYKTDEYDLFGFAVGIVTKDKIVDGSKIRSSDVLVGLSSNGLHCGGFGTIRTLFSLDAVALNIFIDSLGSNLGDELLKPTRIYSDTIQTLTKRFPIHGIAHINNGGLTSGIPRMLPDGLQAHVQLSSWSMPNVYELIRAANKTPMIELFDTFNMGIGMVIAVPADCVDVVVRCARELDEEAMIIGEVVKDADEGIAYYE